MVPLVLGTTWDPSCARTHLRRRRGSILILLRYQGSIPPGRIIELHALLVNSLKDRNSVPGETRIISVSVGPHRLSCTQSGPWKTLSCTWLEPWKLLSLLYQNPEKFFFYSHRNPDDKFCLVRYQNPDKFLSCTLSRPWEGLENNCDISCLQCAVWFNP